MPFTTIQYKEINSWLLKWGQEPGKPAQFLGSRELLPHKDSALTEGSVWLYGGVLAGNPGFQH